MIKTKIKYFGKEFVVEEQEPSTVPELVSLVGEAEIVKHTNSNLRYRGKYPRVYRRVSAEVIKLGFARRQDPKGELISESDHVLEFLAKDPDNHHAVIQDILNRVANEEPLYVKNDRVSGGGRISQGALDAANDYFSRGDSAVAEVTTVIESQIPGYQLARDGEGKVYPESLARGIQALQRYVTQTAKARTKELLATST